MQYRRFGRTELQMPVFSCGGMRYQHSWKDVPLRDVPRKNQENLEATIRRALEVGINHIETARGYGTSEIQLGQILPKLPRDRIIVQTKVSPQKNAREFRKTLEQSLNNLKLDHVELLGIHGIKHPRTAGRYPAPRRLHGGGAGVSKTRTGAVLSAFRPMRPPR